MIILNEENSKSLWRAIQQAGDKLVSKLPDSSRHPAGRNPYAHVAKCIKSKYGMTYKEIPNEQFGEVLDYLVYLVENPF